MSVEYRVGDVFDQLARIPTGSVDLIVTSPPFLALRSYLPGDHPDKHREIGSEATPAEFIDTLLALSAEWGRVLAPHGSLCVELGDTYSGANETGWHRSGNEPVERYRNLGAVAPRIAKGTGWPLAKSLTGIPTLYPWSLAYGRNLLTGQESPAGQWRVRNVIVWARPNPPVGALGDKFRPATSYITVACKGSRRYFDLDAVRVPHKDFGPRYSVVTRDGIPGRTGQTTSVVDENGVRRPGNEAGAPPLDWHSDLPDEDGDWLWKLATQPYAGSHYATFPLTLPKRLIEAMCPLRVCGVCGQPSERIVDHVRTIGEYTSTTTTLGWSDCGCSQGSGHNTWRTGVVLDPFAGSGTTLEAAQLVGRHAIGIDLDHRNADLARERVGMFLEITA